MEAVYGVLIPFLGTSLGAACVFFLKKSLGDLVQRALTGFAAGVMVAASIWSLLIPAIARSAERGRWAFAPAAVGFWVGVLFLLGLDHAIPHLHRNAQQTEGPKSQLRRTTMMVLAVTLHNIPEGMAVGVVYAGYLAGDAQITSAGALALSLGIAIQNFPEGGHHLPAPAGRGDGPEQSLRRGRAVRGGGAGGGGGDDLGRPGRVTRPALSAELCGGGDAVCGGGGADPGDVPGTALQRGNAVLRAGVQRDDGAGCGAGMSTGSSFFLGRLMV